MELIVSTLLHSPTHHNNATIHYYAGNLLFMHGQYDAATENWAMAVSAQEGQLPPDHRMAVIKQLVSDETV